MADANGNHGSPERLIMADKGRGSGFHEEVLRRSPGTQAVLVLEPQNLVQKCPRLVRFGARTIESSTKMSYNKLDALGAAPFAPPECLTKETFMIF